MRTVLQQGIDQLRYSKNRRHAVAANALSFPNRWGKPKLYDFLVRSEGGRIYCDIN
jgi:hypothetical protein